MTITVFFVLICALSVCINAADINVILSELSTEQKVGQMTQLTIDVFMDGTNLNRDKLKEWMTNYHVGSILNTPFSGGLIDGEVGWTPQQFRDVIVDIQEIARNTSNLPVLYGIDSIHGASYVYGSTLFPQVSCLFELCCFAVLLCITL
jgi:beta-glucosidase